MRATRLRLSGLFWRHPWAKALLLIAPPLLAFLLVYIASLVALFISSFWTINPFTTEIQHIWNVDNYKTLWDSSVFRSVTLRTVGIAAGVTLTDAILAFPLGYFMARIAGGRSRAFIFVAVLLPLWSSYLVRVYIWRLILDDKGVLNWSLGKVGLPTASIGYSNWAVWLIFTYVWLPFMILPVYGALERIPESYVEASRDLGASGARTFRSVVLPLALPGVLAGSIFTFSLTLGDYVTPLLAGGSSSQFIGNVVYSEIGSGDVPSAAAFAAVPLAVMGIYLLIARKLGAFEAM
ncbi:MAG TPA: ABC transporter permease [Gaiellaceae bacterium]|nr:ABC transporter permease [Gaiellaceae bacterium]